MAPITYNYPVIHDSNLGQANTKWQDTLQKRQNWKYVLIRSSNMLLSLFHQTTKILVYRDAEPFVLQFMTDLISWRRRGGSRLERLHSCVDTRGPQPDHKRKNITESHSKLEESERDHYYSREWCQASVMKTVAHVICTASDVWVSVKACRNHTRKA